MAFTTAPTLSTSTFTRPALQTRTSLTARQRLTKKTCPMPARHRVAQMPTAQLIGIPDSLRSNQNIEPSAHEVLLGELRFSDPARLPALVESSLNLLDDEFYSFIELTIKESPDLEERETLGSLRDAITDLMQNMLEAASSNEVATTAASGATPASDAVVDAKAVPVGAEMAANAGYDELIDSFVSTFETAANEDAGKSSIKTAVNLNYHRIDLRMLERLSERIVAAGARSPLLARVRDEISNTMNERVSAAMHSVKAVLSANTPDAMRKEVDILSQEGKLDDAFTLLLQANMEQAQKAGVKPAVDAIGAILSYATDVRDRNVDPEIRLVRQLLRTDDEATRMDMLTESLTPRGQVELTDGSTSSGLKLDGKKFVAALRKLIEQFGNVDEKFVLKLSKIGEESEAVARKVYDVEDKGIQEYQAEAFHKRSVSIWDLEEYEQGETSEGRVAPWEGRLGEIPEGSGLGADGKLSV